MRRFWFTVRLVTRNPFVLIVGTIAALFFVSSTMIPPKPIIEFVRILLLGLNGAVVIAYFGPARRAIFRRRPSGTDYLVVGIWIGWAAQLGISIVTLLWRVSGQPGWLLNNDLIGLLITAQAFAAGAHVVAPGAVSGIPRRNMVVIGLAVSFSILGVLGVILFSPDLAKVVTFLRPYLDEGESSEYSHPSPQNQRGMPDMLPHKMLTSPRISIHAPGF